MKDIVVEGRQVVENGKDLFSAQNTGETLLSLRLEVGEDMPLALEHMNKEELNAAVGDAKGGGRPLADIFAMKEIILQLRLHDLIGSLAVVVNEDAHSAGIALLSALAHACQLKGSDGLLEIIFHGSSPFCDGIDG